MRRTKPTRTEQEIIDNIPHIEYGGFMPYPPEKCISPKKLISTNKIAYVDNSFCENCHQRVSCNRYKEFKKEWKVYWRTIKAIKAQYKEKEEEEIEHT